MKRSLRVTLFLLSLLLSASASAAFHQTAEVEITNLTHATYFTPLLVASHDDGFHLFEPGMPASAPLQAMAEGGDLMGLIDQVAGAGGEHVEDPAVGVLAPGATTTASLPVGFNLRRLSIVAMLLPTNDGFVGADGLVIPRWPGVYTFYLNGYDAGTEGNDELITGGGAPGVPGIPADPGGNAGTGGLGLAGADHNDVVHVHPGVVGDLDPDAGPSDLDAAVHRWLNPVAKVRVTVGRFARR